MTLLPKPWRIFGLMGPIIFVAWIVFGSDLVAKDTQMIARGQISTKFNMIGRDFVNVWFGGKQANAGMVTRVYDRDAYRDDLEKETGLRGIYAFSYPPHMLLASMPFGKLPYVAALALWTVLTFGLFWMAARPWLRDVGLPSWSVLMLPASLVNVWAGHFGFLIGALSLVAWRNAATFPVKSGLAFAAMTVKPHLGILAPFLLAATGNWRTIWLAGGLGGLLFAVSSLVYGLDSWIVWLRSTLPFQATLIGTPVPGMRFLPMMPTVERLGAAIGLSGTALLAAQLAFAASALGLLFLGWRRRLSIGDLGLLSMIATFLILPYVFNYDMVALNLAILVLTARTAASIRPVESIIIGCAFLIPVIQMPLAQRGFQIAPLLLLATLAILVRRLPSS